jgi:hypothetical protein
MSLGLGQIASLEPVVEAAIDVGVQAFVGTAADYAELPVKPPGTQSFLKVRKTQEGGVELCFGKFFVSPKKLNTLIRS